MERIGKYCTWVTKNLGCPKTVPITRPSAQFDLAYESPKDAEARSCVCALLKLQRRPTSKSRSASRSNDTLERRHSFNLTHDSHLYAHPRP